MSWQSINSRISECRRSPDPLACLTTLFNTERDGHVAMALGQECERLGRLHEASRWYRQASHLYPVDSYKVRARAAAERIDGRLGSVKRPSAQDDHQRGLPDELHIIECSRSKIWSESNDAPRFVPAREAYLGDAMKAWLRDPRSATHRWLVLSARYGFIDPDQPVEHYNVTFGDVRTGPVSMETLTAQVRQQCRWQDSIPLRRFSRVVVHGHANYIRAVRAAFRGLDAQVVEAGSADIEERNWPTDSPPARLPELVWHHARAAAIGHALGQVPSEVFRNLDQQEPEWPVLVQLAPWLDEDLALLTSLSLGITDYQLGRGGAEAYWAAVQEQLAGTRVRAPEDVVALHTELCRYGVAKRLAEQKVVRVRKLVSRWSQRPRTQSASEVWQWLAGVLDQRPEAKTVVMAMKLADLLNFARTGAYLDFDTGMALPVDLRIARVSLTSGLVATRDGRPARQMLENVEDIASTYQTLLLEAWRAVATAAGGLSLLRIDSLLWQLGELVARSDGNAITRAYLERSGCPPETAGGLAQELSEALRHPA
ncbi:MAG: N-glycosylase/DNA lyase [Vicinamibacterales bacterium]